jgi:tRNA dimethylallyltransferase
MKRTGLRMFPESIKKPLIFVIGPTGVGKSNFAIRLAEIIKGEIISADSRTFYRGMNIGTAKPKKREMKRVTHHLIDIADPDQIISLNIFLKLVEVTIKDIHLRGKIPIVVGGTGQYIKSILEGWQGPEGEPNPQLRSILAGIGTQIGKDVFHEKLSILDPIAARNIDPANLRRTVRAFEVIFTSGKKFSDQRMKVGCLFSTLTFGLILDRKELYERADHRIEKMIENGLKEEVKELLDAGYDPELPSFSAIGYREMSKVINNEILQEEAVELMKKRTRILVRRQSAWFKAEDPSIHWFLAGNQTLEEVLKLVLESNSWISPSYKG